MSFKASKTEESKPNEAIWEPSLNRTSQSEANQLSPLSLSLTESETS
jgi:hypothetical protein